MIDYYDSKLNLVLTGCGFLGSYYIGAICLLEKVWPHKPYNRLAGASCGGLIAALLQSGLSLQTVCEVGFQLGAQARTIFTHPFSQKGVRQTLEETLQKLLPEDCHKKCSNRLTISVTKVWRFENKTINTFKSKQELINAVSASCFIPIWSGSLSFPTIDNKWYIDGAYSNNMPQIDISDEELKLGYKQVVLSPFNCDVDICPADSDYVLFRTNVLGAQYAATRTNARRSLEAMIPMNFNCQESYVLCGFDNMRSYIIDNGMVKCKQCYESNGLSCDTTSETNCDQCLELISRVNKLQVPHDILQVSRKLVAGS